MSQSKNTGAKPFVAKAQTTSEGRLVVDPKELLREKAQYLRSIQRKIDKRILAAESQ